MTKIEKIESEIKYLEREEEIYSQVINSLENIRQIYSEITLNNLRKYLKDELFADSLYKDKNKNIYYLGFNKKGISIQLKIPVVNKIISSNHLEITLRYLRKEFEENVAWELTYKREVYLKELDEELSAS